MPPYLVRENRQGQLIITFNNTELTYEQTVSLILEAAAANKEKFKK